MRTTIRLPKDLHRQLRLRAAESGQTLGFVITEAILRGLADSEVNKDNQTDPEVVHSKIAEIKALYAPKKQVLLRESDGSVSIPVDLIRMARLHDSEVQAVVTEGYVIIKPLHPITAELSGSLVGVWHEDPVKMQRRLRKEWDEAR